MRLLFCCLILTVGCGSPTTERADVPHANPEKVDLLAFIAHPDDEGVWGGALTYYAHCRGKRVKLICLTSGEYGNGLPHPVEEGAVPDCSYDDSDYPCWHKIPAEELVYPNYYREQEMACAAETYGIELPVIHPRFPDMAGLQPWGAAEPGFSFWGGKDSVLAKMTEYIRTYQPEVILAMDWNGFNGNPQHIASARGAYYAAELAASSDHFSQQLATLGSWETPKVYLHWMEGEEFNDNPLIKHDWRQTCESLKENTVQQQSAQAYACHESQEMTTSCDSVTQFVLVASQVGPDRPGVNDFFENLSD
ncbi:MAG: PIG-L family deacetylase [Bacteroidota bacterium]